ncbi:MAG: Endonuclease YhcR, partial [Pseudomonadota bacterium]
MSQRNLLPGKTRNLRPVRALWLSLGWLLAACAPLIPAPEPIRVRVIAFNDFHGNLEAGRQIAPLPDPERPGGTIPVATGGAAALAGTVRALRTQFAHSVVVASGDQIGAAPLISTLFRHESTIEALNGIGVDVATVGNHEFDAGATELKRVLGGGCAPAGSGDRVTASCAAGREYAGARYPTVVANVETLEGRPLFAPAWVKTVGPTRVGFIGAVTRTTPAIVIPSGVAGLRFTDEADAILRTARELRAAGIQTIVATIHEGAEIGAPGRVSDWNDRDCEGLRGEALTIARRIAREVDLILTAHTHQGYDCRIDGRPMMQALSHGRGVAVADLPIDPRTGRVDHPAIRTRNLPVLNEHTLPAHRSALESREPSPWSETLAAARPDPAVARVVDEYARLAAPITNREAGRIGGGFSRKGEPDSTAGRMIADAQLAATRAPERGDAQIAFTNPGGIRTDLPCRGTPPCPVSFGDAFAMQPFGNSLVVMTLTGAEIAELLESQQPAGREAPILLAPSRGLAYRWNPGAPAGARVSGLTLDGRPIDPARDYRVTVNSFLADGGDGFVSFRNGRDRLGGAQ